MRLRSLKALLSFAAICSALVNPSALAIDAIPISPIVDNYAGIPSVPASVAKANVAKAPTQNTVGNGKLLINNDTQINIRPGVNEIISISKGYMNRIVTPYSEPKAMATQKGAVTVKDNVLYVITKDSSPLSVFITEGDSQEEAISITLIPQEIPPREITLRNSGSQSQSTSQNLVAEKWEKAQPYLSTLEELLRTLALGKLPTGYKFQNAVEGELPRCRQAGLDANFLVGQMLTGHNLSVFIGVLTNTSDKPIEFSEASCGDWDVAAVSAFPSHTLQPGKKSEVYVVRKRQSIKEKQPKRPSLITAGEF
ncbi:MAG: conjugal transfer protein TraK [Gammaproteobacteria bacterium]|nr:MAG: conjugal transfer protein TraK [Gammaproteobacteria bacterium]